MLNDSESEVDVLIASVEIGTGRTDRLTFVAVPEIEVTKMMVGMLIVVDSLGVEYDGAAVVTLL